MIKDIAEVLRQPAHTTPSPGREPSPEEWRLIRCYRQLKAQEQDFIRRALEALVAPSG